MKSFEVVAALDGLITDDDIIVSSNGNISREVFHQLPQPQVYLRGSMGLPLSVGLGIAVTNTNKRVVVITGDGNFLMGFGSSTLTSYFRPKNLKVLILDNSSYFTTGGQKTVSSTINYRKFFESLNLDNCYSKEASQESIKEDLEKLLNSDEISMLHLTIEEGKKELVNIPWHPREITNKLKERFISH